LERVLAEIVGAPVSAIYYVVFRIIAAYKASLGEYYKFPLTFRFIK
jgi:uncharacterized Tic20 family protein